MPLTFHLCQLCHQCEMLVSIMPPPSLVYRFSELLSFDLCSFQFVLINEFMGTHFPLLRIILHMKILRKMLRFAAFHFGLSWGSSGPIFFGFRAILNLIFEIDPRNQVCDVRKLKAIWNLIKTELKSCENYVFFLWMIEIGGIIETKFHIGDTTDTNETLEA